MSEGEQTPRLVFNSRRNTELGALSVRVNGDGSVTFVDVLKQITESMLMSYSRSQLGTWTPNRAAVTYSADELAERKARKYAGGEALDVAGLRSLAG